MKKLSRNELFYICDECKHINRIKYEGEFILEYLTYIKCDICEHKHMDVESLANYSKATRGYA